MTRSDEELLASAGRGDQAAFALLAQRHYEPILRFVRRFLGADLAACEDLAQETLLRAWRYAPRFEPRGSARGWLFQIATNACLNQRRAMRLRGAAPFDAHDLAAADTTDAAESHERSQRIRAAVARLPQNQRAAILLRHFEELTYAQIAEALEVSPAAVESLLHRARSRLRELLQEIAENPPTPEGLGRPACSSG